MTKTRKKLIEVALPLEAINAASAREKSIRHGHPSTLHLWWARRPLAAARAVIFAQMVDDPASVPEEFPTPEAQEEERQRLFRIIEDLVQWENTTNEQVLQAAREEIWKSWWRACRDHAGHPRAAELFNPDRLPAFHDPFAGGGALPLEAQRLGLEAWASDLNPVAVLINKAMIEIPPRFAGRPPVNPGDRLQGIGDRDGQDRIASGFEGLAEGDGASGGSVPAGQGTPEDGGVSVNGATTQSSGVGSGEHRGRTREGDTEGLCKLREYREGIAGGDRDVPAAGSQNGVAQGKSSSDSPVCDGRTGQNADRSTSASQRRSPITHSLFPKTWRGAEGLAADVRHYGQWMRDEAEKRIGHLYPKIEVTAAMAKERPDLKPYVGKKLTVIAWLWARTVRSPNPAFADVEVPLASTFMLSTKSGKEAYVEPVIEGGGYRFTVKVGKPKDAQAAKNGTKLARGANFRCLMSGAPISGDYIKAEGQAGRMGARLMAIVAEGERGRVYLAPTPEHEAAARQAKPEWRPEGDVPARLTGGTCVPYGLKTWGDLFTPRQLVALTTFSDLVGEAMMRVKRDAEQVIGDGLWGIGPDGKSPNPNHLSPIPLSEGGTGATAYAEAVGVYLAFAISKLADRGSTICTWFTERDSTRNTFARQSIPMTWDYAELNTMLDGTGSFVGAVTWTAESIEGVAAGYGASFGAAQQIDATSQSTTADKLVSTDPPYYDNIGYADLSDFFYVWLRRTLRPIFPDLYATISTPKAEELVATPYRHGGKQAAGRFFMEGMTRALHNLAVQAHPDFPVTIYYAFKQQEMGEEKQGTSATSDQDAPASLRPTPVSTGWETFLEAIIQAGFAVTGTWPMRTEYTGHLKKGVNALASSIVLVCRPRPADAPIATRREFINALKTELPTALAALQHANIAPVDLAQSAIGPGMAIYTRYARVVDAQGNPVRVREALTLINQVLDEVLAEQEGDFDADTRWALAWFEQHGFAEGDFGVAETLSKAKNTSIEGLAGAGILEAKRGRVRLLKPSELTADWDPARDTRFTHWEAVHHLIRALEAGGEMQAAALAEIGRAHV